MKTMKLTDEEVAIVKAYRDQKHHEEYETKQQEIRANCKHNFEFDFRNYKTDYYKCECGMTTTGNHLAEQHEKEQREKEQQGRTIQKINALSELGAFMEYETNG